MRPERARILKAFRTRARAQRDCGPRNAARERQRQKCTSPRARRRLQARADAARRSNARANLKSSAQLVVIFVARVAPSDVEREKAHRQGATRSYRRVGERERVG